MTRDEDALRAAVERATGRPLEPVQYFRLTDEQRKRHDEAQFRHIGVDPCKQCHPELRRSQCWPNVQCFEVAMRTPDITDAYANSYGGPPLTGFIDYYENPPDEPLGFCAGCGHHPTVCTCRGVCPDCCADDHCQMCDCCCEPETP